MSPASRPTRRGPSRLRYAVAATVLAVSLTAIGVLTLAILNPLALWEPDGRDLADSLQRAGGHEFGVDDCRRRPSGQWICSIEHDPYSGPSARFALTVDEDGCWRGSRRPPVPGSTRWMRGTQPLDACLQVLDFLWPP